MMAMTSVVDDEGVGAMKLMDELRYVGRNVAAVKHLCDNVYEDDALLELFRALDARQDTFYRNIIAVELMSRGVEPPCD